jgi:hypothetical protein
MWAALVSTQQRAIQLTEELAETDSSERATAIDSERRELDDECAALIDQLNVLAQQPQPPPLQDSAQHTDAAAVAAVDAAEEVRISLWGSE